MTLDREATCSWDCTLPFPHDGPCGQGKAAPPVLSPLLELAKAATPGPWEAGRELSNVVFNSSRVDGLAESVIAQCERGQVKENAAFIAAANPAVVLELLAELDAQRATVARLTQENETLKGSYHKYHAATTALTADMLAERQRAESLLAERDAARNWIMERVSHLSTVGCPHGGRKWQLGDFDGCACGLRHFMTPTSEPWQSLSARAEAAEQETARLKAAAQHVMDEWDAKETNEFASIDVLRAVLDGLADKQ